MKLIIPMAGRGSRLRPSTLTTPKPLLKVGGVPILKRLVAELNRSSIIEEVVFIISPDFSLDDCSAVRLMMQELSLSCSFKIQQDPHGIAHTLLCAESDLEGEVLVAFGDMVIENNYSFGVGDTDKPEAVILVKRVNNPKDFGVVETNAFGIVQRFWEKPEKPVSDLAMCGIYYFRKAERLRDAIRDMMLTQQRQRGEFQMTTALQNLAANGLQFQTAELREWHDCGNKDALLSANLEALKKSQSRIAPTALIRNSTLIHPVHIGENAIIINSILDMGTSVGANSYVAHSILTGCMVGENSTLDKVHLFESIVGSDALVRGQYSSLDVSDFSKVTL